MTNGAIPFFLDDADLFEGIALCLSGGGYRAMLFHAGAIWRLNELRLLRKVNLVSSVSGGSIAAGALAVAWPNLDWDKQDDTASATNLSATFIAPIVQQAQDAIDYEAIAFGVLPWDSAFRHVAESYERNITGIGKTLKNLPAAPAPEFVFNTTSLMSGRDWRFSRNDIGDYRVGWAKGSDIALAEVIAASSAFPPFLSPAQFDLTGLVFAPPPGGRPVPDLNHASYTQKALLCDGGVYDNMGLEPAWKRYRTLFVSNAGQPFAAMENPPTDWLHQMLRIVDIMMDQEQGLRERILVYAYRAALRKGAIWGLNIRAPTADGRPALLTPEEHAKAQKIRTRLNAFTRDEQVLLLKAGYALADENLRHWYAPGAEPGTTPPTP
jgi:NTE family protein